MHGKASLALNCLPLRMPIQSRGTPWMNGLIDIAADGAVVDDASVEVAHVHADRKNFAISASE